jgi:hypothetical protein
MKVLMIGMNKTIGGIEKIIFSYIQSLVLGKLLAPPLYVIALIHKRDFKTIKRIILEKMFRSRN